jgi:hypothetical protein
VTLAAHPPSILWESVIRSSIGYPNSIDVEVGIVPDGSSGFRAAVIAYTITIEEIVEFQGQTNIVRFGAGVQDRYDFASSGPSVIYNVKLRRIACKVPNSSRTFKLDMTLIKGRSYNIRSLPRTMRPPDE